MLCDPVFNYKFTDEVFPTTPVAQLGLALPRGRVMGEMWMWDLRVPCCPSWKERAVRRTEV